MYWYIVKLVYDYNTNEEDVDISSASPKFPGSDLSRSKYSYDLHKKPEPSHLRSADALPVHYDNHYDDNIHDEYDDFDNYDGYDYALEKEQEHLHRNYKSKPSLPPKIPESWLQLKGNVQSLKSPRNRSREYYINI